MKSLPGNCLKIVCARLFLVICVVLLPPLAAIGMAADYSIWSGTATPSSAAVSDGLSIEIGVKFRADVGGNISGLRFYKGIANSGQHVGNLWSRDGTHLARAVFTNETASGWQEVTLSTPVAISANTTYVASYYSSSGYFAVDQAYFSSGGVDTVPLHALANGSDGGNGVYSYGTGGFPTQSFNGNNYWVDVVFTPAPAETTPPVVTTFAIPATATELTVAITGFTATDNIAVTGYLVTESSTPPTAADSGWLSTAQNSYTFLTAGTKTLYAWARDAAGNVSSARSASVDITLATHRIWSATAVPLYAAVTDGQPLEVGVKFRSDVNGYIYGLRFYKGAGNNGTHIGNLWTQTGTLLASTPFTNETASGWQEVIFPAPVTITANTTYVASYFSPFGYFAVTQSYFSGSGVDNAPLHALANGVDGGNGVYSYGNSSFPNQSFNSNNYWVDVIFSTIVHSDTTPPTVTAFTVPAVANSLTVFVDNFTATDDTGVTGYLVNESSVPPVPTDTAWMVSIPGSYTFATAGNKILYAWAKDAAGNISPSRSVSVTITLLDTKSPVVSGFTIPATAVTLTVPITLFTATDDVGVVGYLVSESSTKPAPGASGWSETAQTSYLFATAGSKILYAWAKDAAGNVSASRNDSIVITLPLNDPVLIITATGNPFTRYYAEILLTEGLNAFETRDVSTVTATVLSAYDLVILGEMALTTSQATMLDNWVNAGGRLIAMRPDKKIDDLFGIIDLASTMSDAYLLVKTSSGAGTGIVNNTIQYHGAADLYSLNGATSLASLYSNATTATPNPAVTIRNVGTMGGQAAAFTYDLAKSVIYTRQGNPAWSGQERDGYPIIRSDDLFYGNASSDPKPDWVDLNKVAIPQADEQQRLLANLIIRMNMDKKPLPRFWYFPRSLPAVVVMTGDDHGWGTAGTAGRFDVYNSASPPGCSVDNWECIRSTSYVFTTSAIILSDVQAAAYNTAGFEVALHVNTGDGSTDPNTACANFSPASYETTVTTQLTAFSQKFPSLPKPLTNRNHCVAWSDYTTAPSVELNHGIRFDTSYYYWPPGWVGDRPGFFTGSGMPMRFSGINGAPIDTYQAATQMTDESGQTYPATINALLDRAIGPDGYYGAFVANMHTDVTLSSGSDAIINSAKTRGIPVVSARQLLKWVDGRNAATFDGLSWNGSTLSFLINNASGINGLTALVPLPNSQTPTGVKLNGSSISYSLKTLKGIQYVVFSAINGSYQVNYTPPPDMTPPVVSITAPLSGANVSGTLSVTASASDNVGVARVEFYLDAALVVSDASSPYAWSWDTTQTSNGAHTLVVKAYDAIGNSGSNTVQVTVLNPVFGIGLVQKVSNIVSSARSLSKALPAPVTAGNLLVVSVSGYPNLPITTAVSDSLGNIYSIAGSVLITEGAYSALYYAKNIKGGANTVTFTSASSGGQLSMAVAEFSGIDTVSPLDRTAGLIGFGTAPSSGKMTPSLAGKLVIGSGTHNGNVVTSAGSGFTMIAIPTEDSITHQPLAMEYMVLNGNTQTEATFNLSSGYSWTQNGAIFKQR